MIKDIVSLRSECNRYYGFWPELITVRGLRRANELSRCGATRRLISFSKTVP